MNDKNSLYKLALTFIPGIGPVLGKRMVSYLGSVEKVFTSKKQEFQKIPGIGEKLAAPKLRQQALEKAETELKNLEKYKIDWSFYLDNDYPKELKNIEDAPIVIFKKGELLHHSNTTHLAIVGTRKPTTYGRQICEKIIRDLVNKGIKPVIISGLAYGIDICAHKTALELGLPTIAVLANGLNTIYPAAHKNIAEKILTNGLLISENPTQSRLERKFFVRRNRIIAALSQATIIIESGLKGGALITAEYAKIYEKKVFAVPGRITDEKATGCNWLIQQQKAILLDSADTLIKTLGLDIKNKQTTINFPKLSDDEQQIINALKNTEKIYIDNLANTLDWDFNKLLSVLFQLELKGLVEQLPGNFYSLKPR